jgi:UDP-glucose 4-epimerase
MRKYIITGANGFIGKRLTQKILNRGDVVYAIVTDKSAMAELACPNLIVLTGFFADYSSLFGQIPHNEIDCVFHFAWQGLCGKDIRDYRSQLDDAKYACDAFAFSEEIGAKKFVFITSINTEEALDYLSGRNHGVPRYTNIYSISKLAAEMIGKTMAGNHKLTRFVCAQLSMVYGEGNYSMMVPNVVMSSLVKGISPKLIKGEKPYDLVYVGDIIDALIAVGEKGKNLITYPIVHQKLSSFHDLFTAVGQIIDPKVPLVFGAYPGEVEIDFNQMDRTLLQKDTGYVFPDNFESTIKSTSDWIRQNIGKF